MNAPNAPRRWYREPENGWFFGVCAGTANYFGMSAFMVRLLVVFSFFVLMPLTSLMYISAIILLPRKDDLSVSDSELGNHQSPETLQIQLEEMEAQFGEISYQITTLENYVTSDEFELQRRIGRF